MSTATTSTLAELLLSSTSSTSPLPTTQLHSLLTGSLLFSFKSPNASNSTTVDKDAVSSVGYRKTMGYCETANGCGGMLMGMGGKEGRAGVNVWGFQKEQVLQRLIPPVRLSTLSVSNTGAYVAGGTADGRIFFWETSSGTLLLTIDAHYRPISVLEFSHDDSALVSGGEDAGVSVWNVGRLLNATPMDPPTPFATLTDHTLPITAIAVGLGTFPRCRILTASLDATCKIWDISTTTPSLLSTFAFKSSITHVAWDPLERFFFVASPVPSPAAGAEPGKKDQEVMGSQVMKVSLYRKKLDEFGHEMSEAIGGGGRGDVEQAVDSNFYAVPDTITALHLSAHSPTLLLGTSTSTIHVLALPSLLPTRIIPPPLSSTPPGAITFVSTMIRPPDLGAGTAEGGGVSLPARTVMSGGMGRTVKGITWTQGGKGGRTVAMRVGRSMDVRDLINPISTGTKVVELQSGGTREGGESVIRIAALEEELRKVKQQLTKAIEMNDAVWKRVVDGSIKVEDKPAAVEVSQR